MEYYRSLRSIDKLSASHFRAFVKGEILILNRFILLVLLGFCHASAFSGELEILKYRGTKYVSGGMTEDERKRMGRMASRFPMHLVFIASGSDEPISDVLVTVKGVSGNVLVETKSQGPLFYVDVIGGRYTVEAMYKGERLIQTKDLTGRRYLRLKFEFGT